MTRKMRKKKKIQLKKKDQIDDDEGADESVSLADRLHNTTIESGEDD
jgi:hypothetical protein